MTSGWTGMANPMLASDGSDGGHLMDWDDGMLQDLVFAFEACDVDGNGLLDADELRAVIRVLSGVSNNGLTVETVVSLIHEVRDDYRDNPISADDAKLAKMLDKFDRRLQDGVKLAGGGVKLASGAMDIASGAGKGAVGGASMVGKSAKGALDVRKNAAAGDFMEIPRKTAAGMVEVGKGSVKGSVKGAGKRLEVGIKNPMMLGSRDSQRSQSEDEMPRSVDEVLLQENSDCLTYPMFVRLLTSGRLAKYIGDDHDDWEDHAHQMRLLAHTWNTADLDSDGSLTFDEMKSVATTLLGHMTEVEFSAFWKVLKPSQDADAVQYLDWMNGMATAAADPVFAGKMEFLKPNQLMTVLADIPVMAKEERMMMDSLGYIERIGVNVLQKKDKTRAEKGEVPSMDESYDQVLARVSKGEVHELTDWQRSNVKRMHIQMLMWAAAFGFCSAVCTAVVENIATFTMKTNGIENPDTGEPSTERQIMWFGIIVLCATLFCSIIEIACLYLVRTQASPTTGYFPGTSLTNCMWCSTH